MKEKIAAKRGDIAAGRQRGQKCYKFKVGDTLFRILPAKDQVGEWWRTFGQLYLKSFDGKDLVVIGDKFLTYGEEDPIREMVFEGMKHAAAPDIKDHFKEMLGGPRNVFQALILNDKEVAPTEPQLVEVSDTQFELILAQFGMYLDMDDTYDLSSLARGHVFKCTREGTGKNDTKYTFLATPQAAPLGPQILEKLIDMDAWVTALFEAKDQKALGVLAKLGVNVGAGSARDVLAAPAAAAGALAAPATVAPTPAVAVAAATVTTAVDADIAAMVAGIDGGGATGVAPAQVVIPATVVVEQPVIQDAVFVEVAPTPAVAVTPTPAPTPAPAVVTAPQDVTATPAAPTGGASDIDAILASLG
jgi:hypothetical protein